MKRLRGKKPSKMAWEKEKISKGFTDLSKSGFYYSTRWINVRKYVLDNEPLCRRCLENDVTKVATVVDHITPICQSSSDELKFGLENLRPLCFKCHTIITNQNRGKGSAANRVRGKALMKDLEN